MRSPHCILLCLLCSASLGAQLLDYAQGELILQFRAGVDGKSWILTHQEVTGYKRLHAGGETWLVHFDWSHYAEADLRLRYASDPQVDFVQLNHRLTSRRRPNDPQYNQQWQFWNTGQIGGEPGADYQTELAWDITTGGVTANGDTIVIASIDNGIDLTHPDLRENIWVNYGEIPDNGIDDDANGYVDDRYGWNTALDNNDVEAGKGDHGTPVMGQMAAVGNNRLGVTGINWHTKVMHITNDFDPLESEVIQAYGYALQARRRYDTSGGEEGAYVIATNASWGRDRAFPSQSPIWCALYDTLGKYGILSVAAVPNRDVDVDEVGDLPSLCDSEFLITVTNLDTRNKKVKDAAQGLLSVDMAAFGEGVVTTLANGRYGAVFGTSYATPAVTGSIGLLYAVPCLTFGELTISDPPVAARRVRDVLFATVRSLPTLTEATRTGGALDVGKAVRSLQQSCTDCLAPASFDASPPGDASTDLLLTWTRIASVGVVDLRYRKRNGTTWDTIRNVTSPYRLGELSACSDYQLQLLAYCNEEPTPSEILVVESPGCCRLPDDFTLTPQPGGQVRASWIPLLSATSYTLRFRTHDEDWREVTVTDPSAEVVGLRNCRTYEFELRTNCVGSSTEFGRRKQVKTLGCGVCLDGAYCQPTGFGNEQEWIAEVSMPGVLENTSDRAVGAFANYGDLTTASIVPGGVYQLALSPDYRGSGFTQDFHVYVDWNQDAAFAADELVMQQTAPRGGSARAYITVPDEAAFGLTRMRIIMQFTSVKTNGCPAGSNQQFSGEVEDYCLDVTPAEGCPPPSSLEANYDASADATLLDWTASAAPGGSYLVRYRDRSSENFTERKVEGLNLRVDKLNLCSSYEVQVASICNGAAGKSRTVFFGGDCTASQQVGLPPAAWSVVPNPATDRVTVSWSATLPVVALELYAPDGRRMLTELLSGSNEAYALPLDGVPSGIYLIVLVDDRGRRGARRLIVR
ncbi:S8 family serine peptidase [Lewinella sp. IMCC34191]|uniref:S8 family serine peptidase n=1 Tax=Lewinella sp. IMCC34191 TaxID=2259172 RepID=UPI000E27D174|nr:S8 family serine peptidase [Lewinella sp. IMCC34191]